MTEDKFVCVVKIKTGDHIRAHLVRRTPFVIGRSADVDLPVTDLTVSRQHVRVEIGESGVVLSDLNSNNGTFVNGKRVAANSQIPIYPDSKVVLGTGQSQFYFLVIPAPLELMPSDEIKKILAEGMTAAQMDVEATKAQMMKEEHAKITAVMKAEEESLRRQMAQYVASVKSDSEMKAKGAIEAAERKAEQIVTEARQSAESLKYQMLDNANKKKQELQAQIEQLERAAGSVGQVIETKAEERAEQILKNAQELIDGQIKVAAERAEELVQEAISKSRAKSIAVERQIADWVGKARVESAEIIQDAKAKASLLIDEAKKKSENILGQAREDANEEAERLRREAMDTIRAETYVAQEKIVKDFKVQIEKLKADSIEVEGKLVSTKAELEYLHEKRSKAKQEIEQTENYIAEKRLTLASLSTELEKANHATAVTEKAQEEFEEISAKARDLEQQVADLIAKYERDKKVLTDDLESKKQEVVMEFAAFRQRQEDQAASEHLAAMDRIKASIQAEEKKYQQTLAAKAMEITSEIVARLKPMVESHFESGKLFEAVRSATDEVLLHQGMAIQAVTEHLDVERKTAQRKKIQRVATVVGCATAALALMFSSSIYTFLKDVSENPLAFEQILRRRSAESIYTPVQTDQWRDSYTENVVFMKDYFESKTDSIYLEQWTLRLTNLEFLRSLGLGEDDMVQFLGKERSLVTKLGEMRAAIDAKYVDVGLANMKQVEAESWAQMRVVLKTEANVVALRRVEREFLVQYMKVRSETQLRAPTSQQK